MSIKVFFTSDHHWGHSNIIQYCDRPYPSLAAMDGDLVIKWNEVVGEDDIIYHLGDFTLGDDISLYSSQLNGNIFVLTNSWHHDKRWLKKYYTGKRLSKKFQLLRAMEVIESFSWFNTSLYDWLSVPIVLCHYPLAEGSWDRAHYGSLHFHGHCHGKLSDRKNSLDVGVDMAAKLLGAYRPFSLEEAVHFATNP